MPRTLTWFLTLESSDPEFDDYSRRFESIEKATEKLLKDSKAYSEAVTNLFTNAVDYGQHFATIFKPLGGEYGLESKHPEAEHTLVHSEGYAAALEDLKSSVIPELELIESRIVGPIKEFQGILKAIRKSITKREHKVCPTRAIYATRAQNVHSSSTLTATTTPSPNSETRRKRP